MIKYRKVQRDAFLPPVPNNETTIAVQRGLRVNDPYDPGAKVAQQHRRKCRRGPRTEIKYSNSIECFCHSAGCSWGPLWGWDRFEQCAKRYAEKDERSSG